MNIDPAQFWATCSAALSFNQYQTDVELWLNSDEPVSALTAQGILSKHDIWDAEDCTNAIEKLHLGGGNRQAYDELVNILYSGQGDPEKFAAAHPHLEKKIAIIHQLQLGHEGVGGAPWSLIGLDMGKVIALSMIGISAGYLNEETTWQETILPTAKLLQETFSDWQHLARNQILGQRYATDQDDPELKKQAARISQYYWNNTDWKQQLTDTDAISADYTPSQFEQEQSGQRIESKPTSNNDMPNDPPASRAPENTDLAKQWALAANAIIFMSHSQPFDSLEDSRDDSEKLAKSALESWNIESKKDWQHQYNWLIQVGGHRASFDQLADTLRKTSEGDLGEFIRVNEKYAAEINAVYKYLDKGVKPGVAWDLCRSIGMTRWSYLAGYIDADTAWSHILPVARRLQASFDSFIDLGNAFLQGQECWLPENDREAFRKIKVDLEYDRFLAWHKIAWDSDLGAGDISPDSYSRYRYYGDLKYNTIDQWQEGDNTPLAWALAVNGILFNVHQNPLGKLDDHPQAAFPKDNYRDVLTSSWGINNTEDLMEQLESLSVGGGHRKGYQRWVSKIQDCVSEEDYDKLLESNKSNQAAIKIVKNSYQSLGDKGILAWDYCRYIALCRWGYLAEYLDEEGVLELIMPIARMMQKTFASWDEIGENYMLGREFWDPEMGEETFNQFMKEFNRLKYQKNSFWLHLPFDLDLGTGDIHDPNEKPKPKETEAFDPMA